jgi:hypothetical protein
VRRRSSGADPSSESRHPASAGSTPHTAAQGHGFRDRGTPSISAGHRSIIGAEREWGGWNSNPRPADYESRRPAALVRVADQGRGELMRSWLPRFWHVLGMIKLGAGRYRGRPTLSPVTAAGGGRSPSGGQCRGRGQHGCSHRSGKRCDRCAPGAVTANDRPEQRLADPVRVDR